MTKTTTTKKSVNKVTKTTTNSAKSDTMFSVTEIHKYFCEKSVASGNTTKVNLCVRGGVYCGYGDFSVNIKSHKVVVYCDNYNYELILDSDFSKYCTIKNRGCRGTDLNLRNNQIECDSVTDLLKMVDIICDNYKNHLKNGVYVCKYDTK